MLLGIGGGGEREQRQNLRMVRPQGPRAFEQRKRLLATSEQAERSGLADRGPLPQQRHRPWYGGHQWRLDQAAGLPVARERVLLHGLRRRAVGLITETRGLLKTRRPLRWGCHRRRHRGATEAHGEGAADAATDGVQPVREQLSRRHERTRCGVWCVGTDVTWPTTPAAMRAT